MRRHTNQLSFMRDDIRLRKNLTLNLGIRYETSGAPLGFRDAVGINVFRSRGLSAVRFPFGMLDLYPTLVSL
jgi:hypothetical protein